MATITNLTADDLKKIVKDSLNETLSEKKIKKVFFDILEDIALGKAIEEGSKTESIDSKKFIKKLHKRIHQE